MKLKYILSFLFDRRKPRIPHDHPPAPTWQQVLAQATAAVPRKEN